uniref:Uncharacterized protein n=1 Tax=Anguilla anguilla TaxID=7936 RepID=A0A0E9T682_ANGAN
MTLQHLNLIESSHYFCTSIQFAENLHRMSGSRLFLHRVHCIVLESVVCMVILHLRRGCSLQSIVNCI